MSQNLVLSKYLYPSNNHDFDSWAMGDKCVKSSPISFRLCDKIALVWWWDGMDDGAIFAFVSIETVCILLGESNISSTTELHKKRMMSSKRPVFSFTRVESQKAEDEKKKLISTSNTSIWKETTELLQCSKKCPLSSVYDQLRCIYYS